MSKDPVHKDDEDGKWYFWDETWADRVGPFDSEEEAIMALVDYCRQLDDDPTTRDEEEGD